MEISTNAVIERIDSNNFPTESSLLTLGRVLYLILLTINKDKIMTEGIIIESNGLIMLTPL